jgi:hypothetical protein
MCKRTLLLVTALFLLAGCGATPSLLVTSITGVCMKELRFTEADVEYWVPVQSPLLAYFEKELKRGDPVDLFVIWYGANLTPGQIDWGYLVNDLSVR